MRELCRRNVPLVLTICVPAARTLVKFKPDGELQLLLAMVKLMAVNDALESLNMPPPRALPEAPGMPLLALPPPTKLNAMVQFVAVNCDALKIPPPDPRPPRFGRSEERRVGKECRS